MTNLFYYIELDGQYFGPFDLQTVKNMHLTPDIHVMSNVTNVWLNAADYEELIDSLVLVDGNEETAQFESPSAGAVPVTHFNAETVFYIMRGETPYGPYNLEGLASIPLSEDTDLSLDGMMTWCKLRDIPGLLSTLAALTNSSQESASDDSRENSEQIQEALTRLKESVKINEKPYDRVFPSAEREQLFLIEEYNRLFANSMNYVRQLDNVCAKANLSRRALNVVKDGIDDTFNQINSLYSNKLDQIEGYKSSTSATSPAIIIGHTEFLPGAPLDDLSLKRTDFLNVLSDKNIFVLAADSPMQTRAYDFVNTIIGRMYEKNPARLVITSVVDTNYMTGMADSFKLLNRDLYKVISHPEEVRSALGALRERTGNILRNLLTEKDTTLLDYNSSHETKEANNLLVIKDFPRGLSNDNLESISHLSKVGPKAGIYTILLTSQETLDEMTDKQREAFDLDSFKDNSNIFVFKNNINDILGASDNNTDSETILSKTHYDFLDHRQLQDIVNNLNEKCELREDVVIPFADYIPSDTSRWWSTDSARQIEIPFGLGNDMQVKTLKITQESGQNTAVVIGIPGSGKSVFLHSLICNAAIRYSPDALRMYLIDFSGVEFNSYAVGRLPHARVIAPEAEREFGLSILNELVEEGSRRMAVCRDHNVSNIVDLKKVAPEIKVPRLLVIIDEFQKLFEVENDVISREANSKIHIIIQEFRKFGINLILATQKLPASTFLPRDLIANRVVFKSTPNDFDTLITLESRNNMPRLRTGQCVYNCESGVAFANELVQGFFTSRRDIDSLMKRLSDFERTAVYEREPLKVFRSADLPEFETRRLEPQHRMTADIPEIVPVYFGESIAVSDTDVNVELVKENANNILIIGGESEIARNIAYNALRSAIAAGSPGSARAIVLSGLRNDNPMNNLFDQIPEQMDCELMRLSASTEITDVLKAVSEEIELRRTDESRPQSHVYIACIDFQSIRAFDKDTSGMMPKLSSAAKELENILRNGPSVGIFVILQTDTLEALNRVAQSSPLSLFNYRIALQMSEDMSYKIINTQAANRLFVFNRPASRFRGYVRDNARNRTIKFKPYK